MLELTLLNDIRIMFYRHVPHFQFAYRPKSNTTCCLVSVHDYITALLDIDDVCACLLLNYDISKAFDTICHKLLLEKLLKLHFPNGFVKIMYSYLESRFQCVKFQDSYSSFSHVTSGAPQGSLLGPFLFILYCHDLKPFSATTNIAQYADDIYEICPIYKSCVSQCISTINFEYYHVKDWALSNSFVLNKSKTKGIVFHRKCSSIDVSFPFSLVDDMKILGVTWNIII